MRPLDRFIKQRLGFSRPSGSAEQPVFRFRFVKFQLLRKRLVPARSLKFGERANAVRLRCLAVIGSHEIDVVARLQPVAFSCAKER